MANKQAANLENNELISNELDFMLNLHTISLSVIGQGTENIFNDLLATAIGTAKAAKGIFQLFDEQSGLRIVAHKDLTAEFISLADSIYEKQATRYLRPGEDIIVENVEQSAAFLKSPILAVLLSAGIRAAYCKPLFSRDGKLLGMLSTYYSAPHRPSGQTVRLLNQLAAYAAAVIHYLHAAQAAQQQQQQTRALVGELLKEIEGRKLLAELIGPQDLKQALAGAITSIRNITNCQSIAMRLEDQGDYPYFVWEGFSDEFIVQEQSLCTKDETGNPVLDETGQYLLECMCGNVIRGRVNPELPYFSPGGSFWCNSTSAVIVTADPKQWHCQTRGRCRQFESVALVPLKLNETIIGLIQLNDKRQNLFSQELISYLEILGERIGAAVSQWWVHKKLETSLIELRKENLARRVAQQKASEAYQQINQILERITDGFFALDNDWRYIYINAVAQKHWSFFTTDEMLGQKIWDLFPDAQPYYQQYHKAKQENTAVHFETKTIRSDRWLEVHAYPSPDGLSIYFRDITDQKNIKQQEQEYRTLLEEQIHLLDLDPDYTFIHDADGKIVFWGKGAQRGYGWSEQDAVQKDFQNLLKTRFPLPFNEITAEVIANGKWVGELIHTTKDNQQVTVRSCWLLRKQGSIQPQEIIEIDKDITEEKKMREELGRLETMKLVSQIAAGISHEIRNPMTTVRGYLQLLAKKNHYTEEHQVFKLMIEELDRANQIITEFLSLAKNKPSALTEYSLNDIILSLTPLLEADAVSQSKGFQTSLLPSIPKILVNTNEMRQLILNFVRNGLEATGPNGNVRISTYLENSWVILSIEDNGCGIPDEILPNLGTPFLSTKPGGTGLGLPTCYNIARRHNALIDITTSPSGTTFYIKFPANP